MVPGVLSSETTAELYDFVLKDLAEARAAVEANPGLKHRYFSRHIRQTRSSAAAAQTRWELQLPRNEVTQRALEEVLGGQRNASGSHAQTIQIPCRSRPVGALFTALCGSTAELWEFTALLALPGAVPQQLHCDVAGDATAVAAAPPLVTAFVALQQVALLPPGAAAVYDGRLLHCGTGNTSRRPRAQLVLTVRPCGCGAVGPASQKTRRAFPENVTLEELKRGAPYGQGVKPGWLELELVKMRFKCGYPLSERLNYQVPGTASPVQIAVPKPSPLDSPRSTATAATICPVPLSTPAYSERTIASPVVLSSLGRQSPHEKAALRAADRLAETARASLTNGLLWRPAPRPTPDPLLTALGPGGSGEDCCAMVRTPDPPESRKLSAVLESQPSLASSICPGRDSPGPQYTSAILLHTSSSKQNWRQISPGASCVVRPPSPQDVQGPKMMPGSFEELVANGAKAGALKVTLALFDLFCAAVSEKSIVEQVCVELSRQLNREELQWDQLVLLRPLQTLAQIVASLMSGSGPLKEETFWSMLGDEEEYLPWWKALLARHGLQRSGQILLQEQLADLIVSACRMLRDSFAPESYLRNLRTVRFGAHRLQDRYEDFQLLTPSRFGRTYRCRGRASDCLRHVSQV
eukprot:s3120_g10.t1